MNNKPSCDAVVEIARGTKCQTRLKVVGWAESDWSRTILMPAVDCVELPALGPVEVGQIEYIDIRVRFQESPSKYGKPQFIDVAQTVADKLKAKKVSFQSVDNGQILRVSLI